MALDHFVDDVLYPFRYAYLSFVSFMQKLGDYVQINLYLNSAATYAREERVYDAYEDLINADELAIALGIELPGSLVQPIYEKTTEIADKLVVTAAINALQSLDPKSASAGYLREQIGQPADERNPHNLYEWLIENGFVTESLFGNHFRGLDSL